ncbi:MAG: CDP-alcohol phosphatidyltransferase family protein [Planctomycetota bacterium]
MEYLSWPNLVSLARMVVIVPFALALSKTQHPVTGEQARWTALGLFTILLLSDVLDGYLARRLNQRSYAGVLLDPVADYLLIATAAVLMCHEATHVPGARLPILVAIVIIGKDAIVALGVFVIYARTGWPYSQVTALGKWCRALQVATVVGIMLYPDLPGLLGIILPGLWWLVTVLAVLNLAQYGLMGYRFVTKSQPDQGYARQSPESTGGD